MQALQTIDIDNIAQVIMGSHKGLAESAFGAVVDNEDTLNCAVDLLSEIKKRMKEAEAKRTEIVKPINDSVKKLNDQFKNIVQPLVDAENALKPKIAAYQSKLEAERREAQQKERQRIEAELRVQAEEAARIGNIEAAERIAEKAAHVVVKVEETGRGGFTGAKSVITKRWSFEVESIERMATARPDLVTENAVAINAAIRDGERNIPGLRIFQTETVSVRG